MTLLDPRTLQIWTGWGYTPSWIDHDRDYITTDGQSIYAVESSRTAAYLAAGLGWRLATAEEIDAWTRADPCGGEQGVPWAQPLHGTVL